MSRSTLFLDDKLYDYMLSSSLRELPVQRALREASSRLPWAGIESSPEQIQLLQLLVQLIGAKRCVEVGVFTGCSTLGIALVLPAGGSIIACDINESATRLAREYWELAGVASKIELRLAPALRTLDQMLAGGCSGTLDFAYIDADKANGEMYYERVLELLRVNGVMAIDNVFWGGQVVDPAFDDAETLAVRSLNTKLANDDRIDLSMIPLGDGLLLARKRESVTHRRAE